MRSSARTESGRDWTTWTSPWAKQPSMSCGPSPRTSSIRRASGARRASCSRSSARSPRRSRGSGTRRTPPAGSSRTASVFGAIRSRRTRPLRGSSVTWSTSALSCTTPSPRPSAAATTSSRAPVVGSRVNSTRTRRRARGAGFPPRPRREEVGPAPAAVRERGGRHDGGPAAHERVQDAVGVHAQRGLARAGVRVLRAVLRGLACERPAHREQLVGTEGARHRRPRPHEPRRRAPVAGAAPRAAPRGRARRARGRAARGARTSSRSGSNQARKAPAVTHRKGGTGSPARASSAWRCSLRPTVAAAVVARRPAGRTSDAPRRGRAPRRRRARGRGRGRVRGHLCRACRSRDHLRRPGERSARRREDRLADPLERVLARAREERQAVDLDRAATSSVCSCARVRAIERAAQREQGAGAAGIGSRRRGVIASRTLADEGEPSRARFTGSRRAGRTAPREREEGRPARAGDHASRWSPRPGTTGGGEAAQGLVAGPRRTACEHSTPPRRAAPREEQRSAARGCGRAGSGGSGASSRTRRGARARTRSPSWRRDAAAAAGSSRASSRSTATTFVSSKPAPCVDLLHREVHDDVLLAARPRAPPGRRARRRDDCTPAARCERDRRRAPGPALRACAQGARWPLSPSVRGRRGSAPRRSPAGGAPAPRVVRPAGDERRRAPRRGSARRSRAEAEAEEQGRDRAGEGHDPPACASSMPAYAGVGGAVRPACDTAPGRARDASRRSERADRREPEATPRPRTRAPATGRSRRAERRRASAGAASAVPCARPRNLDRARPRPHRSLGLRLVASRPSATTQARYIPTVPPTPGRPVSARATRPGPRPRREARRDRGAATRPDARPRPRRAQRREAQTRTSSPDPSRAPRSELALANGLRPRPPAARRAKRPRS